MNTRFDKELGKWITPGFSNEEYVEKVCKHLHGWEGLIRKANKIATIIDPEYYPTQIKEKFGTLRFYYFSKENELVGFVTSAAESLSRSRCIECGSFDEVETRVNVGEFWIQTLCAVCRTMQEKK